MSYRTGNVTWFGNKLENSSSSEESNFAALMQRAAIGDSIALQELCSVYEHKVRIVARVLLGPALRTQFDSLDLVQSVHRSLLIGFRENKFDISSPEKLIALASTIVRRKVARKWRRALQYEKIEHRLRGQDALIDILASVASPNADPRVQAESRDQAEQLFHQLSADERKMIELRLAGQTSSEIAASLGVHAVALRVRWHRMRQRLEAAGIVAEWLD